MERSSGETGERGDGEDGRRSGGEEERRSGGAEEERRSGSRGAEEQVKRITRPARARMRPGSPICVRRPQCRQPTDQTAGSRAQSKETAPGRLDRVERPSQLRGVRASLARVE